jgi:hypothetical protein
METSTTALLNGDSNRHGEHTDIGTTNSCSFQCFQACHVLDLLAGSSLLLFVGLVVWKHNKNNNNNNNNSNNSSHKQDYAAMILLIIGSLWIVRGVLAKVTKCGVAVSATLSLGLALVYIVLALVLGGMAYFSGKAAQCPLATPAHCLYLNATQSTLLLFALAVVEGIRYIWIRTWMHEEESMERDVLNQSEMTGITSRRSSSQPWWWRNNNGERRSSLASPLLSGGGGSGSGSSGRPHWSSGERETGYHMDSGVGTPVGNNNSGSGSGSWWPFGRRRGNTGEDLRDDGSVDYASLNEDWASRSEEDPFWWTQEGGGGGGGGEMPRRT